MKLLPLNRLGAREMSPGIVDFGLFLPWVSAADGHRMWVKIIHEEDQFLQDIDPELFPMAHATDAEYGDYWSAQVNIGQHPKPNARSAWGTPGRYVYRYYLESGNGQGAIDWIIDPFAREFGVGKLSAFTLGYEAYTWSAEDADWKTPALEDLVFYELMIGEFGGDIDGAIARLDYLRDLGINCIEVMPVSNVASVVDWGFLPIGYFGVDERFGKRRRFQRFVDAAHQRGIAVILDAVYGHTGDAFPYCHVYRRLAYHENPFLGAFAENMFGESTDFGRTFTQDFFFTVNYHWLDCYHVDGFRYDCVPNYYDGAGGVGYAQLVRETYRLAADPTPPQWPRFRHGSEVRLIQCAEHLGAPVAMLTDTYTNCCWQNWTMDAACGVAHGDRGRLADLGLRLSLYGYPSSATHDGHVLPKIALQYIENHDHSRFVCQFGLIGNGDDLLSEGNRALWYKVQPYLIALLTARGIPMLWQGQEFAENYLVPDNGMGRILLFRPVRWDYFYDGVGKATIGLVRHLLRLRQDQDQFRRGDCYFYNHYADYQSKGVLMLSRSFGNAFSLVALNFSDQDQSVPFAFPYDGHYREELHGHDDLTGVIAGETRWLNVPSNYGRIWTRG